MSDYSIRMISMSIITQALQDYFFGTPELKQDAVKFFGEYNSNYRLCLECLGVTNVPTPTMIRNGLRRAGVKITRQGLYKTRKGKGRVAQVYDLL